MAASHHMSADDVEVSADFTPASTASAIVNIDGASPEGVDTPDDAYLLEVDLLGLTGYMATFTVYSRDTTVWELMTAIRVQWHLPRKDMHLVLGTSVPPPCVTLSSLAPTSHKITFTIVCSPRRCVSCPRKRPSHTCGGCLAEWYCSEACRDAAWPTHMAVCRDARRTDWGACTRPTSTRATYMCDVVFRLRRQASGEQ